MWGRGRERYAMSTLRRIVNMRKHYMALNRLQPRLLTLLLTSSSSAYRLHLLKVRLGISFRFPFALPLRKYLMRQIVWSARKIMTLSYPWPPLNLLMGYHHQWSISSNTEALLCTYFLALICSPCLPNGVSESSEYLRIHIAILFPSDIPSLSLHSMLPI